MGGYPIDKVLTWVGELERDVKDLLEDGSPLPAEPDQHAAEAFLVRSYRLAWGWEWFVELT